MTDLVSGEGVSIELSRAGVGSRTVAGFIDLLVQIGLLIVAFILDGEFVAGDPDLLQALLVTEVVLVFAGYPIVFEWLTRGRTLGKMAMGLRVVRDDGGPIGFRQALVRGLSSLLLEKPGLFGFLGVGVALITIGASTSHKRLGDMMAGTFVLNERAGPKTALQQVSWSVPPALYGWAQSLDLSGLDDQLALQVRQFLVRAGQMTPAAQAWLGAQFTDRVLLVVSPPPPPGVPLPILLTTVLAERRRRSEVAAAGSPFTGRPAITAYAPQVYPPQVYPPQTYPPRAYPFPPDQAAQLGSPAHPFAPPS